MNLTCISDTHTKHAQLNLPGGDVLIHAGDFMSSGYDSYEVEDFFHWINKQEYTYKLVIAGNHDRIFENDYIGATGIIHKYSDKSVVYLQDSEIIIDGIKFYGSPWTPEFMGWAFALNSKEESINKWNKIPEDTDILITHGPAFGCLDKVTQPLALSKPSNNLGDEYLAKRIEQINPKLHICGHIHSGQGVIDGYGEVTTHINASCLGEDYQYSLSKNYIEWKI